MRWDPLLPEAAHRLRTPPRHPAEEHLQLAGERPKPREKVACANELWFALCEYRLQDVKAPFTDAEWSERQK